MSMKSSEPPMDGCKIAEWINLQKAVQEKHVATGEIIVFKDETCSGGKLAKQRLTVLLEANMSRTGKLLLLVMGNLKKSVVSKESKHCL